MKKNLAFSIPLYFSVYITVSLLVLGFLGKSLPVAVTNILSLSYFIFLPLYPLFDNLGLLSGEMWRAPNAIGVFLGVLIYDLILYFGIRTFGKILGRS